MGSHFPAEVGPRVVYLDERYDYPEQRGNDPEIERKRQLKIWRQVDRDGGVRFLDRHVEADERYSEVHKIRSEVYEELGHRDTAEFYEKVFSKLFRVEMDVVIISTGVTPFTGDNYHDIGYLRP